MAKVNLKSENHWLNPKKSLIKSEKITPFEEFSRDGAIWPPHRHSYRRCAGTSLHHLRPPKRKIVRSLMSVYFCGGDCVEDVSSHLMPHLSQHPRLRTCSSDTNFRGISELTTASPSGCAVTKSRRVPPSMPSRSANTSSPTARSNQQATIQMT